MAHALVDENGVIQNIIAYDGKAEYTPPDGLQLIEVDANVQIGAKQVDGVFVNPPALKPFVIPPTEQPS
jgi:hypothetical protein